MHEFSIVTQIIDSVIEEAKRHKAKKVSEVHLVIGELTFLGEEAVRTAYQALTKGTILEGSTLTIEEKEGLVRCRRCGYQGGVHLSGKHENEHHEEIPIVQCPKCQGPVDVLEGKDCVVKSVRLTT